MVQQLQLSIGEAELQQLNDALANGVSTELRIMLNALPAADMAHLLESSPPKIRSLIWRLIDQEQEGDILQELSDDVRQFFLERMNIAELKSILEGQDIDDIADLLQQLPGKITQQVLYAMDGQDRQRVEAVLAYPEDSAGGLMNTDMITVYPSNTVDVVLRYLRRHEAIPDATDSLWVVDRNDRYLGRLPISLLLTTETDTVVSNIMLTDFEPINVATPDTVVAQTFERQDLISAPVINNDGFLVGRITIDDVVDVIREEAEHSLMSMAGLDEDEDTFAPAFKTARRRAVWLGFNLITAFIAASVIGLFQHTIDQVVALAVLMPVVAGMGGNAGSQALTLVIRGMALGQISQLNLKWLLSRELLAGLMNGVLWAGCVSAIAWFWFHDPIISLVIALAMIINLSVAVMTGATLPIVLKSLHIDPALAGGIVLTTVSDVVGFLSFLGLATLFYG